MSHWFETIRIVNGNPQNLSSHCERVAATLQLHKLLMTFSLRDFVWQIAKQSDGICRLRIDYDSKILAHTLEPYIPKLLNSLKMVTDNHIDYSFKRADRTRLNILHSKKENCDDVLIIKNGRITDISYANILFIKESKFYTPASPLLIGTKLRELSEAGIVYQSDIKPDNLKQFDGWLPVNALLDFKPDHIRPISSIMT